MPGMIKYSGEFCAECEKKFEMFAITSHTTYFCGDIMPKMRIRINQKDRGYPGFAEVLFWGMSFISTKVLLREYPPVSIAFSASSAMIPLTAFLPEEHFSNRILNCPDSHYFRRSIFFI